MTTLRSVLLLAALVLASTGTLSAWIYSHHRYPYTVYYEQLSVVTSMAPNSPQRKELWVDPQHNLRLQVSGVGAAREEFLIRDAGRHTYQMQGSMVSEGSPLSDAEAQAYQYENSLLVRNGFKGLADGRLAHAVGPVTRVVFQGHQALRFDTSMHSPYLQHLTVWIDAGSHQPLQLQVSYPGYIYIQTVLRTQRLGAGSLPSDFFDPPQQHAALWSDALDWVRGHLGIGH